jgi:hypothetical protein
VNVTRMDRRQLEAIVSDRSVFALRRLRDVAVEALVDRENDRAGGRIDVAADLSFSANFGSASWRASRIRTMAPFLTEPANAQHAVEANAVAPAIAASVVAPYDFNLYSIPAHHERAIEEEGIPVAEYQLLAVQFIPRPHAAPNWPKPQA